MQEKVMAKEVRTRRHKARHGKMTRMKTRTTMAVKTGKTGQNMFVNGTGDGKDRERRHGDTM